MDNAPRGGQRELPGSRPCALDRMDQLANGVHKIGGSSHATVVDRDARSFDRRRRPFYEARTAPVVKAIRERFPGKPLSLRDSDSPPSRPLPGGGIGAFMAQVAPSLSARFPREIFMRAWPRRRTRDSPTVWKKPKAVVIESFGGGPRVLTDGAAGLKFIHADFHAEVLVVVYLPTDKIVIEADHISPRNGQVRAAPLVKEFVAGLDQIELDVATIVGIHGDSARPQAARAAAQGSDKPAAS